MNGAYCIWFDKPLEMVTEYEDEELSLHHTRSLQ